MSNKEIKKEEVENTELNEQELNEVSGGISMKVQDDTPTVRDLNSPKPGYNPKKKW